MILKKIEKDNVIKAIYKSSNILASKYDKSLKELTITFNRGSVYIYKDVSMSDYTRFEISESQGSVLNSTIKKYDVLKGSDVDPATIILEIERHKVDEISALAESIVKSMSSIIKSHESIGSISSVELTRVQQLISKYKNESNE